MSWAHKLAFGKSKVSFIQIFLTSGMLCCHLRCEFTLGITGHTRCLDFFWRVGSCLFAERIQRGNREVKKANWEFIGTTVHSQGESRQTQVSSCPEFSWQAGYVGCRNEGVDYSLGREGFGDHIPWFSSQLRLPEGRRDFCPYLVLIRSVRASGHDGNFYLQGSFYAN